MQRRNRIKYLLVILLVLLLYVVIHTKIQARYFIEGWDPSVSRDVMLYINPNISTLLLKPFALCQAPVFLMIIVCSAPSKFLARNAVRQTWGYDRNITEASTKVYFLLGKTFNATIQNEVEHESEMYHDIIQESFVDTYNNLTLKSLSMLKLVANDCTKTVAYVMKTDDDMFVNTALLIKMLQSKSGKKVLIGRLICHSKPIRDVYDKWYAPEYMFAGQVYPNYLSGTGYVMSSDVAPLLFDMALHTPLIHLEDVYLTGICADLVGVHPRKHPGFSFRNNTYNPCRYKDLITTHYINPKLMHELYFRIKHTNLEEACLNQIQNKYNETHSKAAARKLNSLCF